MLYSNLVLPHIQYCNIIWADNNNCNLKSIHIKQKKIVRLCTGSDYLAHSSPLFKRLKTFTVFDIHRIQIGSFMYQFNNNMLPCCFSNYFTKSQSIHSYGTRTSNIGLYRPYNFSTDLARSTIRRQGPNIWNNIDNSIRNSLSLNLFKQKYKNYLLSCYD